MNALLRSWKTTVAACVTAIALLVKTLYPNRSEIIDRAADVFLALGPIFGLLFAKDYDQSGTPNP